MSNNNKSDSFNLSINSNSNPNNPGINNPGTISNANVLNTLKGNSAQLSNPNAAAPSISGSNPQGLFKTPQLKLHEVIIVGSKSHQVYLLFKC